MDSGNRLRVGWQNAGERCCRATFFKRLDVFLWASRISIETGAESDNSEEFPGDGATGSSGIGGSFKEEKKRRRVVMDVEK